MAETQTNQQALRAAKLMRWASYASVSTAMVLIAIKLWAWEATGSLSILAALIDSLLDAVASFVTLFAVRQALMPPDAEHRFGHGKAEPLAALAQAAFITGSAVILIIEAGKRLFHPEPIQHGTLGIGVMLASIVLTLALVIFQRYVVKHSRSIAISADSLHYKGDLLMNLAVIIALVLASELSLLFIDPIFSLGIAAYIIWTGWQIARGAMDMLMDKELPDQERNHIRDLIHSHPEVLGSHDLKTRSAGPQFFIQCHVEMDGNMSLFQSEKVAHRIEDQLRDAYPGAEILIHQDPHVGEAGGEEGTEGDVGA